MNKNDRSINLVDFLMDNSGLYRFFTKKLLIALFGTENPAGVEQVKIKLDELISPVTGETVLDGENLDYLIDPYERVHSDWVYTGDYDQYHLPKLSSYNADYLQGQLGITEKQAEDILQGKEAPNPEQTKALYDCLDKAYTWATEEARYAGGAADIQKQVIKGLDNALRP